MINTPKTVYISIVAAAILNKYANVSTPIIEQLLTSTLDTIAGFSKEQLISQLRPVTGIADDINNQAIMLTLIEHYWASSPTLQAPLTNLNTLSFGKATPAFRVTDYVVDYGGVVRTPKSEICARLDELERLCQQSVQGMNGSCLDDKALILAHIFGSLIRIHPFEDGNGRTARLFVFYALRCWALPIFPIPKVRNDPNWKAAMELAIGGDALKLKDQLYWRMEKAIKSNGCNEDE